MPDQTEILKAIKVLAEVGLDCEDVELLHQHLREIINAAEKALKPPSQ